MFKRTEQALCQAILKAFADYTELAETFETCYEKLNVPKESVVDLPGLIKCFNEMGDHTSNEDWAKACRRLARFICQFKDGYNRTPLFLLVYFPPETISLLIRAGLNPNARVNDWDSGSSVLQLSIRSFCEPETIRVLLEHGADPTFPGNEDAICAAIMDKSWCDRHDAEKPTGDANKESSFSKSLRILKMLLAFKPNLSFVERTSDGDSPLIRAIRLHNHDALHLLLDEGKVDLSFYDHTLITPLSFAVAYYKAKQLPLDLIEKLLKKGADPYQIARFGLFEESIHSGMHYVSVIKPDETLLALFNQYQHNKIDPNLYWAEHKDRINRRDRELKTPLDYAVFLLDVPNVKALLAAGAQPALPFLTGRLTSLQSTVLNGGWPPYTYCKQVDDPRRLEIAKILIDAAGPTIITAGVIRNARFYKDEKLLDLFETYGADMSDPHERAPWLLFFSACGKEKERAKPEEAASVSKAKASLQ